MGFVERQKPKGLFTSITLYGGDAKEFLANDVVHVSNTDATVTIFQNSNPLNHVLRNSILEERTLPQASSSDNKPFPKVSFTCNSVKSAKSVCEHFEAVVKARKPRRLSVCKARKHFEAVVKTRKDQCLRASAKRAGAASVSDQLRNQF